MLFLDLPIYTNIIMYGNHTWQPISDVSHPHLEHVLQHLQAKGHAQESVSIFMGVKGSQIR